MKPTFIHSLVNPAFEDPSLYVRIMREKRAFLFDIGTISRLNPGDLQKITDVFVTHTHIDHFIGFDLLIRALLRRDLPLRVYGPSNIADCVEGKLKGYTWNLITEYPLKIEVLRVDGDTITSSRFDAENGFARIEGGTRHFSGVLLQEPLFTVKAIQLKHGIPCLAFSAEEEFHINIDKASLKKEGLAVGPWLAALKEAIREQRSGETGFVVDNRKFTLKELRGIAKITRGQKIAYVTDVSPDDENIGKITGFVRGVDTLYCEAYFMDKDRERAFDRFHLTAKSAGRLAREAEVKRLVVMHFSPKYRAGPDSPEEEAMDEFMHHAS
jgi:ribonuclease Z